ncbi:hypothetical protein Leryth_001176 [Lithospermum erythrorhizon]|nr:hypothetical protein Leryth_001176 [Lithospermum erythrorhizon]
MVIEHMQRVLCCSLRTSISFCINSRSNFSSATNATKNGKTRFQYMLLVAYISNVLSQPGGTHTLETKADLITLREDLVLEILRRNSLDVSRRLEFFRWCSSRPNYKHSINAYVQLFKTICRYQQFHDEIPGLVGLMRHEGLVLDPATFKLILDAFLVSGRFDVALELLDHMEENKLASDGLGTDVNNSIIIALIRKGQLSTALTMFMRLLDNVSSGNETVFVAPDAIACNELLVSLRKAGKRDKFEKVFDKLRVKDFFPIDTWGYNICIHAFGCWGDLKTSLSLFKEMKEKGGPFSPDLCTYNSLVQVLCLSGKIKDALIVWEELKSSSGHEPDEFTYRIIIQGCSSSYLISEALKIFNEMQYNGFRPNILVYNSILNGLFKSRKLMEACSLFEKMVDEGVRATCWTYNIVIDGLFKNGRGAAAYTLFCDLKKKGNNFVDGISYSIVILHLCRENMLELALDLVEEMESRGFVVDLVTITSLLIALYRLGRWDWTERLMKHIRDGNLVVNVIKWKENMEASLKSPQSKKKDFTPMFPSKEGLSGILSSVVGSKEQDEEKVELEPDEWSSSPYMDLLANRISSKSELLRVFSLSRGRRVQDNGADSFDIDMVNTYLSIFLAKGKLSVACKLFEILSGMGAEPVSYTYNSIMSSFVKRGYFNEAWGILDAMGENICPADIATYNLIIQGLGRMGRADLASAVLDKLMEHGGYLDIVMYNTLINALGKADRFDDLNKLFNQMRTSGINPDVVTYNTLIEVHSKAGRLKDAYKYLKMMLDAGCAPNHVTDTTLDYLEMRIEKLRLQKASIRRTNMKDST